MNGSRLAETVSTQVMLSAEMPISPAISLAISTSKPSGLPCRFLRPNRGWSNLVPTVTLPADLSRAMVVPSGKLAPWLTAPPPPPSSSPPPQAARASVRASATPSRPVVRRARIVVPPRPGGPAARQWLMILDRKSLARSVRGLAKNSSGGAASRIRPPSMNTTRLAAERAKPISWLTTIMVMPAAARSRMTSRTSLIISGSRAEVGSSNSSSLGSMARARAIATRCCWPPDSWAGSLLAWFSTPTRASSSRARRSASWRDWPRTLIGPRVTLSSTVLWANRLNCWKTMPTSDRSRARARPSAGRGSPWRRMVPSSIGSRRLMVRHRVDLPEPEGPTTTTTSPGSTSRSTSWSTCRSPNHLLTRSIWSKGEPATISSGLPPVARGRNDADAPYLSMRRSADARPLRRLPEPAAGTARRRGPAGGDERPRAPQRGRPRDAPRPGRDLDRDRPRPRGPGGGRPRRRGRLLGRRRPGPGGRDGRRLRGPPAGPARGPRPGLQPARLLQAGGVGHGRAGRRGRAGHRAAGRHLDRRPLGPDHRRPHPPGGGGRGPRGDRLAAAVRDGQGQIPPAAVRAGVGRGGRADRAGVALRRRRRPPRRGPGDRGAAGRRLPERHPLDQVRPQQLAAAGRPGLRHLPGLGVPRLRRARRARGRGLAAREAPAPLHRPGLISPGRPGPGGRAGAGGRGGAGPPGRSRGPATPARG